MSVGIVQTVGQGNGNTNIVLGSNITVGNTLFVVIGDYDVPTTTLSNFTVGGTSVPFSILKFPQTTGGAGPTPQGFAIVMIPNVQVSGSATIAWTYSGADIIASWACEISGLGTNPLMDQSASATGANNSIASGSTGSTTVANEFVLGGGASYNGTTSTPTGTTWANTDLGINSHLSVGWEVQTSSGQTYAWNQATGNNEGWASAVVTIKPNSAITETQNQNADGNSSTTLNVALTPTTLNSGLIATITAWMTSNTAIHIVSVSDNASGGSNTWQYSTATNNTNPPAAGAFDVTPGQYAFTAQAVCLLSGNSGTIKPFTTVTVVFSTTPTSWSEVGVTEYAGIPSSSVLSASNTSVTLVHGTSYTTPSISPPGTVLASVSTSNFGQFTGASSGWTILSTPDAIAGYDPAASGTIAPTFTLGTAADIPTSTIIAIGVGTINAASAMTGTGTLTSGAQKKVPAASAMTGTGTLTSGIQKKVPAASAMTGTGTLTSGVQKKVPGASAMTGTGTLTSGAQKKVPGASAMSGIGTLTSAGTVTGPTSAASAMTGVGTLTSGVTATFRAASPMSGVGTLGSAGSVVAPPASASFAESIPFQVADIQPPPGFPPGPGGHGGTASPGAGAGWEIVVRSYADFDTILCVIPDSMLQGFQFTKQMDDLGSGTVTLSQDDPWWNTVTLGDGAQPEEILDFECLWQFYQDGVVRFEFMGETITEQLVDQSEQRIVTVTGPGTISVLKWAMCAPVGFPNIVLKLDGIEDSFDEVDVNGKGVIDTNIWNSISPTADVYITPVEGLYNYPGGAGYSLSSLYPSGSVTVMATPGTTFFGATPYDATDTLISAQVTPIGLNDTTGDYTPGNLDGSEVTQFYVQSNRNAGYYALMGLTATAFYCQMQGPGGKFTKSLPVYDPTNHAYWQITEQAGSGGGNGTFYFWTSPDGENWTLQWQVVHTWDATDCSFYFTAEYDVANSQSAQMTNLNSNVSAPSFQGALYLGFPIMGIWWDQWAKAQARGTIPFTTTSMTAAQDSFGNPWTDTQNVQTVNGTDMYSFLQSCASVLNADYVMQPGFVLEVGQPTEGSISLGIQRQGQIVFREGRDAMSRQRTRQRNQIQNVIGAQNQDGHEISATDGASVTAWGQREAWYQTGAQVDPTSMAIAAAAAAAANSDEIQSNTLTVTPNLSGKTVFKNFDVGDWVGVEDPTFTVNADRVTAIAVQVDGQGNEDHELTLMTYVQWLEQQLTFVSNQLGGAFVNAPGLTPVAPSKYGTGQVPTYFTPAQGLSNLADVIGNGLSGNAGLQAPLVYNPTTGQYQPAGSLDPITGGTVPMIVADGLGSVTVTPSGTAVSSAGLTGAVESGGSTPTVSQVLTNPAGTVTIIDGITRISTGLQGDGTVTTLETNGVAPAVPDTPTVFAIPAGIAVTWDGELASAAPLLDFLQVQVHVSTSSGFTPNSSTLQGTLATAGLYNVTNLTPGTTYYTKLVAVNRSQVASTPSTQAATVAGFVLPSQISQLTASLIGNIGVLNANPYLWGGDGSAWAGASGAVFTVTATPPAGAPYKYAAVATVPSAHGSAFISESADPWAANPGQQYLVTGWAYSPTGTVTVGVNWRLNGTSVSTTSFNVAVPVNTWSQLAQVVTAPSSGINQGAELWGGDSATAYVMYVQASIVLPQVPGSLIQAGTIEAAQIAAGAVFAGVVDGTLISGATLEGGLILGGLISGAAIEAGLITGGVVSGSTIEGGLITGALVEGIDWEIHSFGVFFYAGTPGAGNLIASFTTASGNDEYGNPFPLGLSLGQPGTGQAQTQPNINQAFNVTNALSGVLTALSQYYTGDSNQLFPGIVGAMLLGGGGTSSGSVKETIVTASPFGTTTGAAMLLESENDGGTDTALVSFGTVSSPDSETVVFTPIMTLSPYAMVMYSGSGAQVVVTKTSGSGTIPIPAGVSVAKGEAWGASGGSGGGGTLGGAAGGGAEYSREPTLAVPPGGTVAYSVGAGGTAGSSTPGAGGTGGNSTLTGSSVTVTAHGGSGGAANGGAGGAGGTGSTNTITNHGGVGGFSPSTFNGGGGGGGSGGSNGPGNAGGVAMGTNGGAGAPAVAGGGAGGAGGFGNLSSFGQAGSAGSTPGGGAGGPGGSSLSAGNVAGHAGAVGQVRLTYITAVPAVGMSVNYGSAFADQFGNTIPAGMNLVFTGTSVATTSASGFSGTLPVSQVDASVVGPVTTTAFAALSKVWGVPLNDAQANTAYRLTVSFSGTTGTSQETLAFRIAAFGATLATCTIGGLQFPISTAFEGTLTCIVACVSPTSARASITGQVSVTANLLTVSNTVNATIPVGGFSGATAITTSVNSSVTLQASWGSGSVGCTVSSGLSVFERLGA